MAGCDEPALGPEGVWKDEVPGVAMEDVWGSEDNRSRGQNPTNIGGSATSTPEYVIVTGIGTYTEPSTRGSERCGTCREVFVGMGGKRRRASLLQRSARAQLWIMMNART